MCNERGYIVLIRKKVLRSLQSFPGPAYYFNPSYRFSKKYSKNNIKNLRTYLRQINI